VIKSVEFTGGQMVSTYHGNAQLNASGSAVVRMPPLSDEVRRTPMAYGKAAHARKRACDGCSLEALDGSAECDADDGVVCQGVPSVMYTYQCTSLSGPMPDLHIAQGVTRVAKPKGYVFIVAGGKPMGSVSWMVCRIQGDDQVRQH
jgi:hypothetical protein